MRRLRDRDEHGVVAVVMALVICLVLIPLAAVAVDLGVQRVARTDMQSVADVVALDTARELNGGPLSSYPVQYRNDEVLTSTGNTGAWQSLQRNRHSVGDEAKVIVQLGSVDPAKYGTDGYFTEMKDSTGVPTAVRILSSTKVHFSLAAGLPDGGITEGGAVRSAIATAPGGACFSIGSYAARLDTNDSPILGPLLGALGSNLDLDALDYTGIAHTDVSLLDLLSTKVGAGTLEELIEGDQLIGIRDFYLAVANALEKDSGETAEVGLLTDIANSLPVPGVKLPIGQVLNLGTGGAAAGLDAMLNVFDLVTTAAMVAEGQGGHAVDVPALNVDLGPIADVAASASVVSPPQLGCGRVGQATAQNSQVQVDLSAGAANVDLGLIGTSTQVSLSGSVDVAAAKGTLKQIRCDPKAITVAVRDGLIKVNLTLHVKVKLLGIPLIDAPIVISGESPAGGDAFVDIANNGYDVPGHVGDHSSGLPWLHTDTGEVSLLFIPLGKGLDWVLDPLLSVVVNPVIQALDTSLLTPLLGSLGLDVSGADVYAKPTPQCGLPKLVG